jgi:hypothetical protein
MTAMTEAEWLAAADPIKCYASELGWPSPRKQRLFAVACCRRLGQIPSDDPRAVALKAAERYADRETKKATLKPAREALGDPEVTYPHRTYDDLRAAFAASAAVWACHPTARHCGNEAAHCADCAAAYAALPAGEAYVPPAESPHRQLWYASRDAERTLQVALLREIGADPFHPPPSGAGRLSPEIVSLATACYCERLPSGELDAARLAVLSDALEEAVCDEVVVAHLRSAGPHVRGCWAVDLILGKK